MKPSSFVIAVVWFAFLADACRQGIDMPSAAVHFPTITGNEARFVLVLPFLFFAVVPFLQRKQSFPLSFVTKSFDRRFGPGALSDFFARLKVVTLFMLACIVLGATGLVSTYLSTQNPTAYFISGSFISGGLGLFVASLLSIKFPPRLP